MNYKTLSLMIVIVGILFMIALAGGDSWGTLGGGGGSW